MSGRDLYKRVLQFSQDTSFGGDMSPMSSLAHDLHESISMHTPVKRLSLNTNSSFNSSFNKSLSSDGNSSVSSSVSNYDMSSPQSPKSPIAAPPSCDKENYPNSYYSPSRPFCIPRIRSSPLKDLQNVVNRNLMFPASSPLKKHVTPKKSSPVTKSPVDDFDTNSQDSGYSESNRKESGGKRNSYSALAAASNAPRRLNLDLSPVRQRSFASLSCDEDAMFLEMLQEDSNSSDNDNMCISSLLSAPIQQNMCSSISPMLSPDMVGMAKPPIRRCLSMMDTTPTSSKTSFLVKPCPKSPTPNGCSFKRPHPPMEAIDTKRRKSVASPVVTMNAENKAPSPTCLRQMSDPSSSSPTPKPKLMRSHSESQVSIMKAISKSTNHEGELTGDFSRPICLPTIEGGKHADLKAISVHTMASLVRGEFKDNIKFKIIDCRYPYEYEGGHIKDAVNWHHPRMVLDHLQTATGVPKIPEANAPHEVLIFHCEFSAERGPKAQRLLRNQDRIANKDHYPALHFPEMYLLEGGYKVFYEHYPELCTPETYVKMLDPKYCEDFKHFRVKSKSWAPDNKNNKGARGPLSRTGSKRLGL